MTTYSRRGRHGVRHLEFEDGEDMRAPAYVVTGACAIAVVILLLAFILGGVRIVHAHPGRLDAHGCHEVRQDFHYSDGRVLKAGERHCHRLLGIGVGITLDGTESLQDGRHEHDDPREDLDDAGSAP